MIDNEFVDRIKTFYFDASIRGFASNGIYKEDRDIKGRFVFRISEIGLTFEDSYVTHFSWGHVAGQTTIFDKGVPVWVMQYFGFYEEPAIDCVKFALSRAYDDREFFGGRGNPVQRYGNHIYRNIVTGDFTQFFGREEVLKISALERSLGWHTYQGGFLKS